jgi:hypothetical protein
MYQATRCRSRCAQRVSSAPYVSRIARRPIRIVVTRISDRTAAFTVPQQPRRWTLACCWDSPTIDPWFVGGTVVARAKQSKVVKL